MKRSFTLPALSQLVIVITGYFGLGIVLKVCGYPDTDPGMRWNPLALMLRTYGLCLLILPVTSMAYPYLAKSRGPWHARPEAGLLIGWLAALGVIGLFLQSAVFPSSHSHFNYTPQGPRG